MPKMVANPAYAQNLLMRGVDYTHEQMMLYMLSNPGATLAEIGAYFGYSAVYISQIKSSDAWKARFAELQGEVASGVLSDIPAKLQAMGEMVVEKLSQKIEQSDDPRFIKESFDSVLSKLGYGNKQASANPAIANTQTNVFMLGNADLAQAREAMSRAQHAATKHLDEKTTALVEYEMTEHGAVERPQVRSDGRAALARTVGDGEGEEVYAASISAPA